MKDRIDEFFEFLQNSEITSRYTELEMPDDFDNRDEFIAQRNEELLEDEETTNQKVIYAINGFENSIDLADYLNNHFNRFKTDLLTFIGDSKNLPLFSEFITQAKEIISVLENLKKGALYNNNIDLISLIGQKINYTQKLILFLNEVRIKILSEKTYHEIKDKEILSTPEAAIFLNLSEEYLRKLTSRRMIPHSKPGGKNIYFNKLELEEWIANGKVPTQEEIDTDASTYLVTGGKKK